MSSVIKNKDFIKVLFEKINKYPSDEVWRIYSDKSVIGNIVNKFNNDLFGTIIELKDDHIDRDLLVYGFLEKLQEFEFLNEEEESGEVVTSIKNVLVECQDNLKNITNLVEQLMDGYSENMAEVEHVIRGTCAKEVRYISLEDDFGHLWAAADLEQKKLTDLTSIIYPVSLDMDVGDNKGKKLYLFDVGVEELINYIEPKIEDFKYQISSEYHCVDWLEKEFSIKVTGDTINSLKRLYLDTVKIYKRLGTRATVATISDYIDQTTKEDWLVYFKNRNSINEYNRNASLPNNETANALISRYLLIERGMASILLLMLKKQSENNDKDTVFYSYNVVNKNILTNTYATKEAIVEYTNYLRRNGIENYDKYANIEKFTSLNIDVKKVTKTWNDKLLSGTVTELRRARRKEFEQRYLSFIAECQDTDPKILESLNECKEAILKEDVFNIYNCFYALYTILLYSTDLLTSRYSQLFLKYADDIMDCTDEDSGERDVLFDITTAIINTNRSMLVELLDPHITKIVQEN